MSANSEISELANNNNDSDLGGLRTDITVQVETANSISLVIANSDSPLSEIVATVAADLIYRNSSPSLMLGANADGSDSTTGLKQKQKQKQNKAIRLHDANTGALLSDTELLGNRTVLLASYKISDQDDSSPDIEMENDGNDVNSDEWTVPERTNFDQE